MRLGRNTPDDITVFPVGHYLGPFHPPLADKPSHHAIRVGRVSIELRADLEFDLWTRCHDFGKPTPTETLTRDAILDAGYKRSRRTARKAMDNLVHRQLIAQVGPADRDIERFARTYRIAPLGFGLGNTADEPDIHRVGMPGQEQMGLLGNDFELWQWGHVSNCLWAAYELSTQFWGEAGADSKVLTDTASYAKRALMVLQFLIARRAAYLDLAR